MLEIDNIINRKDFDRTKIMLLFIEVINLLRIDDKLFDMVIDNIRNLYQSLHNSENRDFFLDRFIEFRNFLRFRLKYDKNIDLIDLDEQK